MGSYKTTNILAANCPRVANNILNLSLCIAVLPSGKILELTNLFKININKNFKNTSKKCIQIDSSVLTKLLISQLL